MASRPRDFESMRPVLITLRCIWRLNLLELEGLRELFLQQLALNASRCGVDVLAWAYQSNHAHLIVRQRIDGHCPDRRGGIAALMRNVLSVVSRYGNARGSYQGRFFERTYRSHVIRSSGDLVRFLAYVHGQREHHGLGAAPSGAVMSSAGVLGGGEPDGVVELVPDGPGFEGLSFEERCERFRTLVGRIVQVACAEEHRVETAVDVPGTTLSPREIKALRRDAWRRARAQVEQELALLGLDGDACDFRFRPLHDWIGVEAVAIARERVLGYVWVPSAPHLRRAPRTGDIIEIRVRYERPPAEAIA